MNETNKQRTTNRKTVSRENLQVQKVWHVEIGYRTAQLICIWTAIDD
jgi:hypothetical protein